MEIKLSNSLLKCYVDDEDWFLLSLWKYSWRAKWSYSKEYLYIATTIRLPNTDGKTKTIYLHRLILNIKSKKIEGHHKDENPFNNHRDNLEPLEKNNHIQKHVTMIKKAEDEVPF